MEKKSYEKRQAECGLKVCDKVRVLRKADDYEDGWDNTWAGAYMDDYVGRIGKIVGERPCAGFRVFCEELNARHQFPYFVLEKVEDNETPKHVEPVRQEEKKLTNYKVFTTLDCGEAFNFAAISKEENNESIIFTEENGGTWEFYKKHIVAIKKA